MTVFNKQMLEAALWTFLETFFATLALAIVGVQIGDWNALGGIAISAALSAIAAALSIFKSVTVRRIGAKESIFISGGDGS